MSAKIRRSYKGAAISAALSSGGVTSSTQTSISLSTSPSTWPTGKFFVVVAPGTAQEEKMCVTLSGSTLTVVDPDASSNSASTNGRGADDTTARSVIAGGSVVYPVFTATDADEANELTSTYTTQGDLVYQGASTFTRLGVSGVTGYPLIAGASVPSYAQVTATGIANNAVTTDKINNNAVTTDKINNNAVTLAKLASAVQNLLVPVGTVTAFAGSTAPTGWLLCDGSTFNAITYPNLNTVLGGNTLPNFAGRFPIGKTTSGTGSTLLGTGGSTTIAEGNLPSHTHSINHDHAPFNTNTESVGHTHEYTLPQFGTQPTIDATDISGAFFAGNGTAASGGQSNSHTHPVDVPAFTGTSGTTGGGTAYFQPFVAVNYIIKHD